MIDANSQFFAILTNVGMAKQANADALGIPWRITEMGVGDANGTDPVPSAAQTKLINEWRRRPLNQLKIDPNNPAVIIAEQIIPADEGGKWIREIGLYDADGDLVAVANCAPSFKPILSQGSGRTQIVRMNFIVSSTGNITLKIDPSVVLATREYVDVSIVEALAKLDFKHSALVATTANIVLSDIQTIDGVLLPADARVLVKNQTVAKDNGLYVVPAAGAWKRSWDADNSLEVTPGLFISVEKGTVNGDSVWQLVTDGPIVLGTTDLLFEMAVGRSGISAGSYASVTVDKYGRVVAGTNPTTLAGHGILDAYTKAYLDIMHGLKANLADPIFTGVPRAPTAAFGTNSTQLATTAYVLAATANLAPKATTLLGYGIADAATSAELESKRSKRIARVSSAAVQVISGATVGPVAFTPLSTSFEADGGMYKIRARLQLNCNSIGMAGNNYITATLKNGATQLDSASFNIVQDQQSGYSAELFYSNPLSGTVNLTVNFSKTSVAGSLMVNGDRDDITSNDSGQLSLLEIFRTGAAT